MARKQAVIRVKKKLLKSHKQAIVGEALVLEYWYTIKRKLNLPVHHGRWPSDLIEVFVIILSYFPGVLTIVKQF